MRPGSRSPRNDPGTPGAAVLAVGQACQLAPAALAAAVGPIGGSAIRLLDAWGKAVARAGL